MKHRVSCFRERISGVNIIHHLLDFCMYEGEHGICSRRHCSSEVKTWISGAVDSECPISVILAISHLWQYSNWEYKIQLSESNAKSVSLSVWEYCKTESLRMCVYSKNWECLFFILKTLHRIVRGNRDGGSFYLVVKERPTFRFNFSVIVTLLNQWKRWDSIPEIIPRMESGNLLS